MAASVSSRAPTPERTASGPRRFRVGSGTSAGIRAISALVRTEHEAAASLLVLGKGTVGSQLLALLADHEELRLVGVVDSRAVVLEDAGLDPRAATSTLAQAEPRPPDLGPVLDRIASNPVPILVDVTAAPGMDRLYLEAFRRGIHVVTVNKKPLAGTYATWAALRETARAHRRAFRYETTVGAALPVVRTLQDLVRTGDRVHRIEGSLSGTLGYLSNELAGGSTLSDAVRRARDLGFTEPHPGDDLSGTDAARKAVILARELGHEVALADVEVAPFVPADVLGAEGDRLWDALRAADDVVRQRVEDEIGRGLVPRYLVRVEGGHLSVGPVAVPPSHPAAAVTGSASFVAFYTDRYAAHPLVVQGAGAGGLLTASGVFADVLAIAEGARWA